uniref:Uncharacterized protein n=1 Tax=Anguilla anguilla TaxID=7936 RepID=A0A0E9TSS7_ANGAN
MLCIRLAYIYFAYFSHCAPYLISTFKIWFISKYNLRYIRLSFQRTSKK